MISSRRDILVLLPIESISDHELASLHSLLHKIETPEYFCLAHELVDRNRISRRPSKILKESRHICLRAFRFLINRN